ncbi:HlyU family transcriptional regulator [Wenxinia marina]|uniref:Transcriptional activator HlyU n=1 Tax=Wenxinia marina DSM 24838 TaxID=1123501 RepID=A0A0D0Q591_9RHOB|nr:HlyU family transcriptional regulator [Wenxinia marina]KIQ69669.1 hypothetical protein Wenmar_02033 [Wenxinia marina DSM 24838]GGL60183.1 transcriptional activator HlyU [Wenxinia marina]
MSILSRLFGRGGAGGSSAPEAEPEMYNDFAIFPQPIREGTHWRVAARIEKGERTHHLIRADTMESEDVARETSLAKAKQMIDQMGDGIFG